MKNLFVSALLTVLPLTVMAGSCPMDKSDFKLTGWQKNTDDEFLYDKYGRIYECDNEFCAGGSAVTLAAGHIWQGETINRRVTYRCHQGGLGGEDRWEVVNKDGSTTEYTNNNIEYIEKGCGIPIGKTRYAGTWSRPVYSQNTQDNEFIYANGLVYECDNNFCSEGMETCFEPGHYWKGKQINSAVKYKCIGRRKWQQAAIGQTCAELKGKTSANPGKKNPKGPANPVDTIESGQQTCESSGGVWYATNKSCVCDAVKNLELLGGACKCKSGTNWIDEKDKKQGCKVLGGSDENELKNKCEGAAAKESGAAWNETTKQCDCADLERDGKKYPRVFDAEKSQCVLDAKVDECLKIAGAFWSLNTGCACKDSTLEPDFSKMECVKTAETIKVESSVKSQKIISATSALQGLESALGKVTVWKTADGKFNAARLASDLTAGVVLGTTGALVTSHLVKKKQVEDGFEDIQCTVGGQVVAGWGDEFIVGMQ